MNWIDTIAGGLGALGDDVEDVKTRLDRVETWITQHGETHIEKWPDEPPSAPAAPGPCPSVPVGDGPCSQEETEPEPEPEPKPQPASLEAAKEAARRAVAEPEPVPQPDERQARTPVEMVEAILSNLTLCIEGDDLKEIIRYAKQAQRWALILKKEIKNA